MLGSLRALLVGLIDIILLRRGPDALPTSQALLALTVGASAAISAFVSAKLASEAAKAWPVVLALSIAFVLGWYYVTLKRAKKPERFVQTMTAMFGVNALTTPIIVPLLGSFMSQAQNPAAAQAPVQTPGPLVLVALVISVWVIAVNVHIVRSALEWTIPAALGFFVAQNLAWFVLSIALFGGGAAAPSN
jgi:hypothetical protein